MVSQSRWIQMVIAMMAIVCAAGFAETYHLSDGNQWQNVASNSDTEYLLAVSKIKQQLLTGTKSDVVSALQQLKSDFPQMAGEEIDAYIAAEELHAQGAWYKAATAYRQFITNWPTSVLRPAALERYYSIATAYLQGQKRLYLKVLKLPAFDTGVELMREVADRAGDSPLGLRALTTLAESQEAKEMFLDSYYTWQEIADRWPTGQTRQTAVLRMGQALHASYNGDQYDAAVLESAQTYFEDYLTQYPGDADRLQIPETLNLITEQLAYKEYRMGFYYERTGNEPAALPYYQKVIDTWPTSKAAQMAQARLAPNPASPINKTVRRRTMDGVSRFLDTWFWTEPLFNRKQK